MSGAPLEPAEMPEYRNRMAIAALALVGLFVSMYLLLHKLRVIGTLTCGVGDCATVQLSPYAVFFGIPVPVLGVVGYLLVLGVAIAGLQRRGRGLAGALLLLSFGAFGFSVHLTALEAFVIHAWCQWCVASAIVATLIFVFSLAEIPRLREG